MRLKRRTILTLLLITTMTVGLSYGAIVNYISSQITKPVTVESPVKLEGKIAYQTIQYKPSTSSYSTTLAKWWWGQEPFDYTDESFVIWDPDKESHIHPEWNPTEITIEVAEGKITFTITMPTAFNPDAWVNDNFALTFDEKDDGVPDFQVLYNTIEDPVNRPEFPHWATKICTEGVWSDLEPVPNDWTVSESVDLKVFTISMPVGYLGGMGSTYSFALQVVKYIPDENADPLGYPWSTQSLVVINIPEEGCQEETVGEPRVVTEYFDHEGFSETLHGGDEIIISSLKAKNLANKPIDVMLGIALESGSPMTGEEIIAIDPAPGREGACGNYWVAAYRLGTIEPGQTVTSEEVTIQLAPDIAPGEYTIRVVAVWTNRLAEGVDAVAYIAEAAENAPLQEEFTIEG